MAGAEFVIVALPNEDDYVRKISSEKEPHLTLLYLGDPGWDDAQMTHVQEYIEHAASYLCRFLLDVDSRGVLGPKDADVLFFSKEWTQQIAAFRTQLLRDPLILTAYLNADQFPQWTPHMTLGYPETPAHKDTREFPGISYVNFDKVALWTVNSSGPTFPLKSNQYSFDTPEMAMSSLTHHGVKGMKWGVRRDGSTGSSRARTSEDAKATLKVSAKAETHGTQALSNRDLQSAITRLNLENQYHKLTSENKTLIDSGHKSVKKALAIGKTFEEVRKFMDTPTGKAIAGGITLGAAYFTGGGSAAAKVGSGIAVRRAANHFTNTGN